VGVLSTVERKSCARGSGQLPLAILDGSGEEMPRAFLQGMLADFLCAETMGSPA